MESSVSRQTTGLLVLTSLILHALLLCALLISYHVHSLLLTKELKQAVPACVGPCKYAPVIFRPLRKAQPQPSLQQSQSTTNMQSADAGVSQGTATGPAMAPTLLPEQMAQTTVVSDQTTAQPSDNSGADSQDTADQNASESARTFGGTESLLDVPLAEQKQEDSVRANAQEDIHLLNNKRAQQRQTASHQQANTTHYWASSGQQSITLQDVTRGFLKSVRQERQHDTNAVQQLVTHDMVSRSYETKVFNILKKSVAIEAKPIAITHTISTPAEIVLTINKSGKLINFEFKHRLAQRDLKAVEDVLRRAACSTGLYPAFPRMFTQDMYKFSLPLQIEVTQGLHSYQLSTYYRAL